MKLTSFMSVISLIAALLAEPVLANSPGMAVARCAEESPVAAAEQCLKSLDYLKSDISLPPALVNSFGSWDIRQRPSGQGSDMDVFLLLSELGVSQATGESGETRATLVLRCLDNTTGLYFGYGKAVAKNETLVAYRLDNEPIRESVWTVSTDFTALFPDLSPINLVKEFSKSSVLRLWFFPKGEAARSVSFDLRGLSNAIVPIQKACHWQ